jgi:glutathione S-transferase
MPFGQVPILRVGDSYLAQSNTICRYLAGEFGLAGKDDWEEALCDSIVDAVRDIFDFHREWRSAIFFSSSIHLYFRYLHEKLLLLFCLQFVDVVRQL